MDQIVIELKELTKRYGSFTAVDNLNLEITRGEVFGLLGPNGAGKSTAILMMLGLTDPTSGSVKVCGIDSTTCPIEVKKKVGYLPEDVGFYDDYSGIDNLVITALLNGKTVNDAVKDAEILLDRVGLAGEGSKKAGKYSKGMRQRLGLADVLIKTPEIIILDEPTLGIDPKGVNEFLGLIRKLSREEGNTVLLCSHHLHQVQEICDRVGLFVGGKLIAEGNIETLSKKIFEKEPVIIEARAEIPGADPAGYEKLKHRLANISGVLSIELEDNSFRAGCSGDVTGEIARVIMESGASLRFLTKKEYVLNEIYHRYFEGVENHG